MNHINHVLFHVLKTCQNTNPGDAHLRNVFLAAIFASLQAKMLGIIFNIQAIECYSFQGSHLSLLLVLQKHTMFTNIFAKYIKILRHSFKISNISTLTNLQ